jgi:hypothetical protein
MKNQYFIIRYERSFFSGMRHERERCSERILRNIKDAFLPCCCMQALMERQGGGGGEEEEEEEEEEEDR